MNNLSEEKRKVEEFIMLLQECKEEIQSNRNSDGRFDTLWNQYASLFETRIQESYGILSCEVDMTKVKALQETTYSVLLSHAEVSKNDIRIAINELDRFKYSVYKEIESIVDEIKYNIQEKIRKEFEHFKTDGFDAIDNMSKKKLEPYLRKKEDELIKSINHNISKAKYYGTIVLRDFVQNEIERLKEIVNEKDLLNLKFLIEKLEVYRRHELPHNLEIESMKEIIFNEMHNGVPRMCMDPSLFWTIVSAIVSAVSLVGKRKKKKAKSEFLENLDRQKTDMIHRNCSSIESLFYKQRSIICNLIDCEIELLKSLEVEIDKTMIIINKLKPC